jgi:AcrR family transcriptional regulator
MPVSTKRPAGIPTSEVIEAAAIDLFYEHGYDGTSIRDIAKASNVAIATMFHHYSSKAELLYQILQRGFEWLTAEMEREIDGITDPPARLAAVVNVHVRLHCADPRRGAIVVRELRSLEHEHVDELLAQRDRIHALFADTIASGVASGQFSCARPRETARAIHSMCSGVLSWYREGQGMRLEEIADLYSCLALRMVGSEPVEGVLPGSC